MHAEISTFYAAGCMTHYVILRANVGANAEVLGLHGHRVEIHLPPALRVLSRPTWRGR
jgi:hypothetical protein